MNQTSNFHTIVTGKNNIIIDCSNKIEKFVTVDRHQIIGKHIREIIPCLEFEHESQYISVNNSEYRVFTSCSLSSIIYSFHESRSIQSIHDSQTGLYNKDYFKKELLKAMLYSKRNKSYNFAILMMDIDDFKGINDTYGHICGDVVIDVIAQRIKECVREVDIVARFGGDEFVVLLNGFDDIVGLQAVGGRILESMKLPIFHGDIEMFATLSIGILCGNKVREESVDDVLNRADMALYNVKTSGKNGIDIYTEDNSPHKKNTSTLINAIKQNQIAYEYQPVVTFKECNIVGYEIYSRLVTSDEDTCFPEDFLNFAKKNKLIYNVDILATRHAFELYTENKIKYFINISTTTLQNHNFLEVLSHLSTRHNTDKKESKNIVFECNEKDISDNMVSIVPTIQKLRKMGFSFCLDNFGEVSGSLNLLYKSYANYIKVSSRVAKRVDRYRFGKTVTKSLMTIAKMMNVVTIGTEVESPSQAVEMNDIGCEYIQGYLIQ